MNPGRVRAARYSDWLCEPSSSPGNTRSSRFDEPRHLKPAPTETTRGPTVTLRCNDQQPRDERSGHGLPRWRSLPKKFIRTDEYTTRTDEYRTSCVRHTGFYAPQTLMAWLYHLPFPTLGGQCPLFKDHRIEIAMKGPPLGAGITFTQPYHGL